MTTAAEFHRVGKVADFPPGEMKICKVDGRLEVVVAQVDGQLYAFSNACTHAFHPLGFGFLQGCEAVCIHHWAIFDIRDGSVIQGPAFERLPVYEVRVQGDDVEVGLPPKEA